jgi:hypothetical protein
VRVCVFAFSEAYLFMSEADGERFGWQVSEIPALKDH